jgi:hypothetical protein
MTGRVLWHGDGVASRYYLRDFPAPLGRGEPPRQTEERGLAAIQLPAFQLPANRATNSTASGRREGRRCPQKSDETRIR